MNWYLSGKPTKSGGFSLIELMVVVAIGGVMVTMAVPAYCKYASSAKQAQAKSLLSSIWVAEQSFAIGNQSYTACLADIGVNATNATPLQYYAFGFNYNLVSTTLCGPGGGGKTCFATNWSPPITPCAIAGYATSNVEASFKASANMDPVNLTVPGGTQLYPPPPAPPPQVKNTSFFAMAVGNISTCNSAYDKWTIDQTKAVTNVAPAL